MNFAMSTPFLKLFWKIPKFSDLAPPYFRLAHIFVLGRTDLC